jgi:formate--tetrahydrofolate ligase
VQTLEGGPAFIHAGLFGNIAHGCNSILATRAALALADVVVTEAGFGSDLGAEKFFDIKCRAGGLNPEAAVLVATVRSLKMQGGADKKSLTKEDLARSREGYRILEHHLKNVRIWLPCIPIHPLGEATDTDLKMLNDYAAELGARVVLCEVFAKGGEGGEALAREVLALLAEKKGAYRPLYDAALPIKEKIDTIVKKVYGGDGADYSPAADRAIEYLTSIGLGGTPVCIAKTQYSLTDDATRLGKPKGVRITLNEVSGSAGAGCVVARAG